MKRLYLIMGGGFKIYLKILLIHLPLNDGDEGPSSSVWAVFGDQWIEYDGTVRIQRLGHKQHCSFSLPHFLFGEKPAVTYENTQAALWMHSICEEPRPLPKTVSFQDQMGSALFRLAWLQAQIHFSNYCLPLGGLSKTRFFGFACQVVFNHDWSWLK